MNPPFQNSEAFALSLDEADPLRSYRSLFHIPTHRDIAGLGVPASSPSIDDRPCIYLCGNSLGCMPRAARGAVEQELADWQRLGVEAHLHGQHAWLPYHEFLRDAGARLVGARTSEVVMMNSLTVNLHLMMVSFYRPTRERYKIVIEDSAFPSDSYAVASQAAWHGLDPAEAIVRLKPRAGEQTLREDDIEAYIKDEGASVALVMLGGVNYLTGQLFHMERITAFARAAGCIVGWDLAHAAGNVPLKLHDWDVDFAAWCSYKYLNGGPGAVAGCFVHEKHSKNTAWTGNGALPRFAGWWGNAPATRFKMGPDFVPVATADAWQLSNPPILAMAPLRTSLEIFDRAGMTALREKSVLLTGYLEWLLTAGTESGPFSIITPREPERRGCSLSIAVRGAGKELVGKLRATGVVGDFREPNVIRAAPVPLYFTFHEAWRFAEILKDMAK
ncbi:MAG: kynureninase [Pyrinomonadaceae bacterium]|nr:kynureninase [Phycisphaerales bacterium]